jgi:hypothetical protein
LIYYKIQAKESESAIQIIRTLKNSNTWARTNGNPLEVYSASGNDHTSHVLGIAKEFNATVAEIEKADIPKEVTLHGGVPRREYIAFDGTVFTDKMLFNNYQRNNNPELTSTRKTRWKNIVNRKERKPRSAKKPDVIYRIEPNQDFTLAGVINTLQILEDKLLKAYTEVSEVRKNLGNVADIQKLLQDKQDYLTSAKHLLTSIC